MNWKEILRPTIGKIVLTLILVISYQTVLTCSDIRPVPLYCQIIPVFGLPSFVLAGLFESLLIQVGILNSPSYVMGVALSVVFSYFISVALIEILKGIIDILRKM